MKSILVVEDELSIRETMKLLLQEEGYLVYVAASPKEAILKLEHTHMDLVITDINMNGDGLVLIAQMAAEATYMGIPVIAMTAASKYKGAEYKKQLPNLVMKPFSIDEFLTVVERKLRGE